MKKIYLSFASLMLVFSVSSANAAGIIDNGTIQLGVDDYGQLNVPGPASPVTGTPSVGLRYLPTGNEATSHGCLCEGWGVGNASTGTSGSANNNFGVSGLSFVGFASDGVTAVSAVDMGGELLVEHRYTPSSDTNLYSVLVTITNIGVDDVTDVRYRRTFDWDIEPTTFDEYSTIGGTAGASAVILASNDGFGSSDPFASMDSGGTCFGGGGIVYGDFVDNGPCDQGASFDFSFTGTDFLGPLGKLETGDSMEFEIFYGAAATEAEAFASLAAVDAEVYSLGQASNDPGGLGLDSGGNPTNTFIFGFKGVGGDVVVPMPAPASLLFLGLGLMGLGGLRRRAV